MGNNVGGVGSSKPVYEVDNKKPTEKTQKKEEVKNQSQTDENELMSLEEMVEDGMLKPEKLFGLFKTGNYILTADGKKSFAQIKEEIGLEDGALQNSNYKLFQTIRGNYDSYVPKEGTKITIRGEDIKPQALEFKDDEGNPMTGFYKTQDGRVFYEVQYGDTQTSIYEKFANKALKDYVTTDALRGYPEHNLQVGSKVELPEKSFLGKLFS